MQITASGTVWLRFVNHLLNYYLLTYLNFNPKLLADWKKFAYLRLIFDLQLVVFNFVSVINEGLSKNNFTCEQQLTRACK